MARNTLQDILQNNLRFDEKGNAYFENPENYVMARPEEQSIDISRELANANIGSTPKPSRKVLADILQTSNKVPNPQMMQNIPINSLSEEPKGEINTQNLNSMLSEEDVFNKELKDELKNQKIIAMMKGLGQAASEIGSSIAGGSNTVIKPTADFSAMSEILGLSKDAFKQKQDFRKEKKAKEERDLERKRLEKEREEDRNLKRQIFSQAQQDRLDRQKDLNEQRKFSNIERFQNSFNKDKVTQDSLKGLASAEDAEYLLNSNTPIADEAIKRSLARLSGEVGVLTDQDVAAFGGSKAVKDRVQQSLQQMYDGRLTDTNRKFMSEIINVFKKRRQDQLDRRAIDYSKQASKRFDIDDKEALEYLRPGSNILDRQAQSNEVERLDKKTGKTAIFDANTKQFIRWK